MKEYNIIDMQEFAKTKGGKCLSNEYITSRTKLKWLCNKGHKWDAIWDNIKQGSWCPKCAHIANADRTRGTLEEIQKIAESKGGICISKKYTNSNVHLEFRCKNGHPWKSRPSEIKRGRWCKLCGFKNSSMLRQGDNEDIKKIISAKKGTLLTDSYKNNRTKIKIECEKNHSWITTPHEIRRGRWCPYCLKGSRSEQICRKIFERLFENRFPCIKPKWLKNSRGNQMELDGYCEELKIAFEYQGRQHYEHHDLYSKDTPLNIRKEDDLFKEKLCNDKGIILFVIPYTIKLTKLPEFIIDESRKKEIIIPNPEQFDVRLIAESSEKLERIYEYCKSKCWICLSETYVDQRTPLKFKCDKNHSFEMQPKLLFRGTSCPLCLNKRKLTLEDMKIIAQEKLGFCLSKKYLNNHSKLIWQCSKGHKWYAKPSNIMARNSWCPTCAHNKRRKTSKKQ